MRTTTLSILAATLCCVSTLLAVDQARASDAAAASSAPASDPSAIEPAPSVEEEFTREMRGRADMNGDGQHTVMDLALMLMHWGNCELRSADPCPGDINADGAVDEADLSIMLSLIGLRVIPVIEFPATK